MGASTLVQVRCEDLMNPTTSPSPPSQSWEIPELPPIAGFNATGVASRDVVVNKENGVWVRLFLPESALSDPPRTLPLLIHVHGGGFVRFSPATASYHDFCEKLATDARVLVLSLNHRLAPAFRLPAAFHDLAEALHWLQAQALLIQDDDDAHTHTHRSDATCSADPWLAKFADFTKVIFMGGSSGGNIVHNTLLGLEGEMAPVRFVGQVLLQPFFGGVERMKSEVELAEGPIITLPMSDQLWSLALPEGAGREHRFCDPLKLGVLPRGLPKALVVVGGRDLLHDRQVEFATFMKAGGVDVKLVDYPEATHGFVTSEGSISYVFMAEVLSFIASCRS